MLISQRSLHVCSRPGRPLSLDFQSSPYFHRNVSSHSHCAETKQISMRGGAMGRDNEDWLGAQVQDATGPGVGSDRTTIKAGLQIE